MRILHVPYCFHPDPHGGTEVYVEALSRELRVMGMECEIAAPGTVTESYEARGLKVHRYALSPQLRLEDQYGEGDPGAAAEFGHVLERVRPDVVHLHAFTAGVSLRVARIARAKGLPVMVTYHTPTVTCVRGTLLRWGKEICDGRLDVKLCAACSLQGHGMSKTLAQALVGIAPVLPKLSQAGGVWTALQMPGLMRLRHETVKTHLAEADHVVAVCEWVRQLLIRNGLHERNITLCRQGVANALEPAPPPERVGRESLKVAFFGRLDPTKGVHVLVGAVRRIPKVDLELHIYGVQQGAGGARYERKVRRMADGDRRIQFHPPVPQEQVGETLRGFDLLAVPSQLMETGPLVVYEAMEAGLKVLGSKLGGIEELISDERDGILLPASQVESWAKALTEFAKTEQSEAPRTMTSRSRSMAAVALEMQLIYRRVLDERPGFAC